MRKLKLLSIGILLLLAAAAALFLFARESEEKEPERESVAGFPAATFEYVHDTGCKLITSEIGSLATFDSLALEPSDEEFSGDWIYRITFNPKAVMPEGTEFVVLFSDRNVSVNGKTYAAAEGVDYGDILNWAKGKYHYFDYELLQE